MGDLKKGLIAVTIATPFQFWLITSGYPHYYGIPPITVIFIIVFMFPVEFFGRLRKTHRDSMASMELGWIYDGSHPDPNGYRSNYYIKDFDGIKHRAIASSDTQKILLFTDDGFKEFDSWSECESFILSPKG